MSSLIDFTGEKNLEKMLKEMDRYLRDNLQCEDSIDGWLTCGVPDASSDEDFKEYSKDREMVENCLYEFAMCILLDEKNIKEYSNE